MNAALKDTRDSWSASLYAGFVVLTVAVAFRGSPVLLFLSLVLLLGYLLVEVVRVPPVQRWVGLALGVIGLASGGASGDGLTVAIEGINKALQFLVLFSAVACLRLPAIESPSLRAISQQVVLQPPGRRFLAVASGAHIFGAVLNLAGLQLVATVLGRTGDAALRQVLSMAMIRGFAAATCWSPLYTSTAVVLSVLPGLSWLDVALPGAVMGILLLLTAWLVDMVSRGFSVKSLGEARETAPVHAWFGLAAIFLGLCLPVILLVEISGLAIPIAVGIVTPIHALTWLSRIRNGSAPAIRALHHQLQVQLPALRSEVLLFTGASIFGTGIAAAAAGSGVGIPIPVGDFAIVTMVVCIALTGLVGLHPVIPVIVIGQMFTPEALGLSSALMGTTLMASWGLATLISPFSGTTLYVARLLDISVWTIAWRWNAGYGLAAAVLVSSALIGLRRIV